MSETAISVIFLDIGNVLLTNGWDRPMHLCAAEHFGLDYADLQERHDLVFDTCELGKLTLNDYLQRVVFYRKRDFSPGEFTDFMFSQSRPQPEMLALARRLKERHRLKIVALSNETRELTAHRVDTFKLREIFDFFIVSCFVHLRKPDPDIFRLALDSVQAPPSETLYIDDREIFIRTAGEFGINGIHHTGVESTRTAIESFGFRL